VFGLLAGIYNYRPQGHELEKVTGGDVRADLCAAAVNQECVKDGAAVLVFAAVYERTTGKYGEGGAVRVHGGGACCPECLSAGGLAGAEDCGGVRMMIGRRGCCGCRMMSGWCVLCLWEGELCRGGWFGVTRWSINLVAIKTSLQISLKREGNNLLSR